MRQLRQRHGAHRVVLAEPAPLQEAEEHAQRRERARQAAAADTLRPARGEEGAHVARGERVEMGERRQAVQLRGEEGEELAEVAAIGLGGIDGELALDREISMPRLDRALEIGRGDDHGFGFSFGISGQAAIPHPTL